MGPVLCKHANKQNVIQTSTTRKSFWFRWITVLTRSQSETTGFIFIVGGVGFIWGGSLQCLNRASTMAFVAGGNFGYCIIKLM